MVFIEFIKDMLSYIIVIAIIILIRIFLISTVEVVGESMEPNFTAGEMLLADQLIYKYKDLDRFDIIIFKHESPTYLIKRVIGLPGETVSYIDNQLYINNEKVKEDFKTYGPTENFSLENLNYEVIPKDMYFVIGDNRSNSLDSRSIGLISKNKITGKPFLRVWPLKELKTVK
ncbi:MAG: signal peptidase I [Bacilli bacterium]|nr:signal peptidase I [Bacilli bacterium]